MKLWFDRYGNVGERDSISCCCIDERVDRFGECTMKNRELIHQRYQEVKTSCR